METDVRNAVREIVRRGDGIVTGGAIGVDYFATDEVLKYDSGLEKLRIYLPTSLAFYTRHIRLRVQEGVASRDVGESLIEQLTSIRDSNSEAIIDGEDVPGNKYVETWQYYERNTTILDAADELIAFLVNESEGTRDAIEKAKARGMPVKVFSYRLD